MVRIAHTVFTNPHEAVADLAGQLGQDQPKLLFCFSSTLQEPKELVRRLHEAYPKAILAGGTTAGEIITGKVMKGSVVVMALDSDIVEKVASTSVTELGPKMNLDAAFAALEKQMGSPLEELDPNIHVGIVITDGLSGVEEHLIESIAKHTEIAFVGGSAGDDLKFESTRVFLNRNALEHSAVLLLLRVPRGFDIIKTQSFQDTGIVVEATEVDQPNRKILAIDHRPAVYAYGEAVGAHPDAIAASFTDYPLARMVGGEPFVRSPQRIEGTAIKFYSRIVKGEKLSVMKATDILTDTAAAIRKSATDAPIQGIVDFHCTLRAQELESRGQQQEYGKLFGSIPTIGFSTYGEAWTTHFNQTSTMLAFR